MIRRSRRLALLISAAMLPLPALVYAQPAPNPAPVTKGTGEGNTITDIYGAQNMSALPGSMSAASRRPGVRALGPQQQADILRQVQGLQEQRVQPPADLKGYIDYVQRDALLERLGALAGKVPHATPELLVLLAWNHVALDMTSIDHTSCSPPAPGGVTPQPGVVAGKTRNGSPIVPAAAVPVDACVAAAATFGEQWGPARASRAMAIAHLAMFEAANTVDHQFHSYRVDGAATDLRQQIIQAYGPTPTRQTASVAEAIDEAAFRTLSWLYPRKAGLLLADQIRIRSLVVLLDADPTHIANGERLGDDTATVVTGLRTGDGSVPAGAMCAGPNPVYNMCYEPRAAPPYADPPVATDFTWHADPISRLLIEVGGNWNQVSLFAKSDGFVVGGNMVLPAGTLHRPLATDASFLDSVSKGEYGGTRPNPHGTVLPVAAAGAGAQVALNKYLFGTATAPMPPAAIAAKYGVRNYGASGALFNGQLPNQGTRVSSPTDRTAFQTAMAEFWGYDGVNLLCAPPRLYNMIATSIFLDHAAAAHDAGSVVAAARYLAVLNLALADAGIEAWTGKFATPAVPRPVTYLRFYDIGGGQPTDATWTPLGQTGSNGLPYNTTPPFPAWPSGHAVFGGAAFTAMANLLGLDKKAGSAFDFVSDEFNGHTVDGGGNLRPYMKVHFASLDGAEWENAESRVWLGIHWQRDADDGSKLGDAIGANMFRTMLTPCGAGGC